MSSFIKKIGLSCAVLVLLTGCSETFKIATEEVARPKLGISIPEPLKLRDTDWKVIKVDDVTYFGLTADEFTDLTKNTEDVQNRLYLYHSIIEKQQDYYEKTD